MKLLNELIELIDTAIDPGTDNVLTQWGIIAKGYNTEVDTYRNTIEKWHEWIAAYKMDLIEQTQIKNLRIKYTSNVGYFIEISKNQASKLPEEFIHIQTLVWAIRYSTPSLQKFQSDSQLASSALYDIEYSIFLDLRNSVLWHFDYLYSLSRKIEKLDFYTNAANISLKNNYITPKLSPQYSVNIVWWRHPVMEQVVDDFIKNDITLESQYVQVITWPNMWWKSTFLRQNALLILLSHIWFDIPATSAIIPITDRIFSRVWSWDNLFLGQSTFMVEMQEIAYILKNSTKKSFIIIDEIWRGTSTYDGMSLAWSILRYIHNTIKAKTLFATHYHEIIDFSSELSWVGNYSVAVWENDQNIIFLRKIIPWGIKKSYWIEVARLAWIPEKIVTNANITLQQFHNKDTWVQLSLPSNQDNQSNNDMSKKIMDEYKKVFLQITDIDINSITPIQALSYLENFQRQAKKMK